MKYFSRIQIDIKICEESFCNSWKSSTAAVGKYVSTHIVQKCQKREKIQWNKYLQGHPTQTGFFEAGESKMDMGQFYSVGWTMSIHRPLELQTADWPGKFGNLNMRKDIKKSHLHLQKSWKNWRVWLKNYSCPSYLYFELKMAGNRTILQLKKF